MRKDEKGLSDKAVKGPSPSAGEVRPAIGVMRSQAPARPATASPFGISLPETWRIWTTLQELNSITKRPPAGTGLAWAVLGDDLLDLPEREAREKLRRFESRIATDLRRAGYPVMRLTVIESDKGFHANVVTFAYPGIERLRDSALFGDCLRGKAAIQPVTDIEGLASYLSGERVTQAKDACNGKLSARVPGSHRLETRESGDRVRLSRQLAERLEGVIRPYRRSYAKLNKPPPALPAIEEPPCPPLLHADPVQLVAVAPVQLDMFGSLQAQPVNVFDLAEERRRRGLSQRALASLVGLRQPHVANVERGHDRLSAARIRALRHVLDAIPAAA